MIDCQKMLSDALEAMRVDDRDAARDQLSGLLRCVCLGDPLPMVRIIEDEDGETLLAVTDSDQPRDDDAAFDDDQIVGRPCGRRGCNQWIADESWQFGYCADCCSAGVCEHGNVAADCQACCIESDRAYDESQEQRR